MPSKLDDLETAQWLFKRASEHCAEAGVSDQAQAIAAYFIAQDLKKDAGIENILSDGTDIHGIEEFTIEYTD